MKRPKYQSPRALQKRCDRFNQKYPAGTGILVLPVMGEPETVKRTVSRHGASVLGGHTAVVHVIDGGGCWALDHVVGRAE